MIDLYIYAIAALLPISACMLIFQTNPYNALIVRGILGAVAALTYAILGAADVALTEALMGTLLAITLYAVAVRSSMVMRLGVISASNTDDNLSALVEELQGIFRQMYMRVKLIHFENQADLEQALIDRELHAVCLPADRTSDRTESDGPASSYQINTRIQRLYEIMQTHLSPKTTLNYVNQLDRKPEAHK